jgi:demethylmenaquinone methyltransferase/2-methoxy-6-polyprenyl-1,4-benzoquinol methylase
MIQSPQPEVVQKIFTDIAQGYDSANDAITFGMARLWRRQLVKWSGAKPGDSVLDCATGTGDLALDFKRVVGSGRVVGTDFCQAMLDHAPAKAKKLGLDVEFAWADAMDLKFADGEFDICSIAYGIRNVGNAEKAIREMARVVRSGGSLMILETGDDQHPVIKWGLDLYFQHFVPLVGGWITGKRSAYQYLSDSTGRFPSKENFAAILRATNCFSSVEYRSLMGGASFIYKAVLK